MSVIYSAKDKPTFQSARWNSGTNPDLSVVSSSLTDITQRTVLPLFPRSQHRPVLTHIGISIPLVEGCPKSRWNFARADWPEFTKEMDHVIQFVPAGVDYYDRFVKLVKAIAKKHIPRGYRKQYIPGWNDKCNELFRQYTETEDLSLGHELLHELNIHRNAKWQESVQQMDCCHSSRKAWALIRNLGSTKQAKAPPSQVCANDVASRLVLNSKLSVHKDRVSNVRKELYQNHKNMPSLSTLSSEFSMEELDVAILSVKARKAPGFDNMFGEFIKHFDVKTKQWILRFFNEIMETGRIPKIFKKSKIITVIKPGKDGSDVSHLQPLSLLSRMYTLFERLILNRIGPIIDQHLPKEQAAFRSGRSCDEQVLALTTFIERGFQNGLKPLLFS